MSRMQTTSGSESALTWSLFSAEPLRISSGFCFGSSITSLITADNRVPDLGDLINGRRKFAYLEPSVIRGQFLTILLGPLRP